MKKLIILYHGFIFLIILIVGVVLSIAFHKAYFISTFMLLYLGLFVSLLTMLIFSKTNKLCIIVEILILLFFFEINVVYVVMSILFGMRGGDYVDFLNHIFIEEFFLAIINWSILVIKIVFITYLIKLYIMLSKEERLDVKK